MRTHLNTLIRYRQIDSCLKRIGLKWTWKELAEECGKALRYHISSKIENPSRRTILYDISRMKSGKLGYEAPIAFDAKKSTYYYTDSKFSINATPITKEDVEELNHALIILKQFSGFDHVKGIENIITKLEDTIQLTGKKPKNIIQFDHSINATGQEFLDKLYRYTYEKITLDLVYKPFNSEYSFPVILSPYLLKEYNKRWYLIGWNHSVNKVHHFALDRMVNISKSNTRYFRYKDFTPENYFKDIIGVTFPEGGKIEKIIFEAEEEQAKYIITKPIHPTQVIQNKLKGKVKFSINVIINYELESLLLSFGEKVKVIKPIKLKNSIKRRVKKVFENYYHIDPS